MARTLGARRALGITRVFFEPPRRLPPQPAAVPPAATIAPPAMSPRLIRRRVTGSGGLKRPWPSGLRIGVCPALHRPMAAVESDQQPVQLLLPAPAQALVGVVDFEGIPGEVVVLVEA